MQITETTNEGLKRGFKVVIPSNAIETSVQQKIASIAQSAQLPGFRPGKVPTRVLRQRFGRSVLGEVLQETLDSTARQTI